jgi:tetratricopeptide (TPR) repeat protein
MISFRNAFFILFFNLIFGIGWGQLNLDSLSNEFNKLPNDSVTVNNIYREGLRLRRINIDASQVCFGIGVEKAKKINDKALISRLTLALGTTYNIIGEFGTAAQYLIEGLKIAEEIDNKELILKGFLGLGNMYAYSNQPQLANVWYVKALKVAEGTGSDSERATIYNNMGGLLYKGSNLNKDTLRLAISYFLKALAIVEKSGTEEELIMKYNNLGLIYCDSDKPDSALYYLERSKKLIDLKKNADDMVTYYNYLGRVYVTTKQFDKAEKAYLLSLEEAKKYNDPEWVYEGYISMAGLYENKGDFKKAFEYYRRYSLLKDSVMNESNFAMASDIKNKFEREKKEAELSKLKAEQAKNRIFDIALILVSVLLVISGIMMYSRFKIKAESERRLRMQNEVITQKNKDITDSINYAHKIQLSILPSEKFIEKEIKRLKD